MKVVILFFFVFISIGANAQKEGSVQGNTVTFKEVAPVWPGCEGNELEKKKCFNENLALLIQKNFSFKNWTQADKGSRILVHFIINKDGNVEIESTEGGSEAMQKEAKRVILLLPKMKPGSIGGKNTEINYTVPFNL
ncbi:MAG TPA: energy transducer TonB [Flavobacteriaceae bacterium]|nr:energy transducer TonB [Flavobacteriaceae bacterium]